MEVEIVSTERGTLIVKVHLKYLDARHAAVFREKVIEHLHGCDRLIIDCSHVLYVDSTGLASLVSVFKALDVSGRMSLIGLNEGFSSLLEQTKLHRIFPFFDNPEEAMQAWGL